MTPLPGSLGLPPRAAGVDIGTNTCSMALVGRENAGPAYEVLEDYSVVTSLGKDRRADGRLHSDSVERTLTVLRMFRRRLQLMDVPAVFVSATSAVRDAPDGAVFADRVETELGFRPEILDGEVEATTTFAAVEREFGGRDTLVQIDVGGGSTELAGGDAKGLARRISVDLGALRCTERQLRRQAPPDPADLARLEEAAREALRGFQRPESPFVAVGVGGTATTLLAVRDGIEPYDGRKIHGATCSVADLRRLERRAATLTVEQIAALPGMEPGRAPYALAGSVLLRASLEHLGATEMKVSDRGLRYGLMYREFPTMIVR